MSTESISLNYKVDKSLKEQADKLFKSIGITTNTAINMFLKQSIKEQKIPFDIENKCDKIYTIEEIKSKTYNIFKKYDIKEVYLFGSYARKEANKDSDIDIMLGKNTNISLLQLNSLIEELENSLEKKIDIVLQDSYEDELKILSQNKTNDTIVKTRENFYNEIRKDLVLIYE